MSLGSSAPLFLPMINSERLWAQSGNGHKKFIFYHTPYGAPMDFFVPNNFAMDTATSFNNSKILSPLVNVRNEISVVSGIRFKTGRSDGHFQACGWLTSHPISNADPTKVGREMNYGATSESLDALITRKLCGNKLISLSIGHHNGWNHDTITWTEEAKINKDGTHGKGKIIPISDPIETWNRLFGSVFGNPTAPDDKDVKNALIRRGKLFQALQNELNSAKRFMSAYEYQKIDQHIESINGLLKELDPETIDQRMQCGFPEATGDYDRSIDGADRDKAADLQIRMACEALKCGTISTVSILTSGVHSPNIRFTDIISASGFTDTSDMRWHKMHHFGQRITPKEGGSPYPEIKGDQAVCAKNAHAGIAKWNASQVNKIITELKAGGVFKDSVVVWSSCLGNNSNTQDLNANTRLPRDLKFVSQNVNSHSHGDLPFVIAGNLGGSLNMGKHFYLGNNTVNQTSVLTAIGRGFGVLAENETFGHPDFAQEPFDGLVNKS